MPGQSFSTERIFPYLLSKAWTLNGRSEIGTECSSAAPPYILKSATDRIQVSPVVIFYFHPAVAVYEREFCWITRIRVIRGMIIAIMKTLNCDGGVFR